MVGNGSLRLAAACWVAALGLGCQAQAVEIRIDYRYDRHGFFDQPEARVAMEAAAQFFSDLLDDELLAIDPTTDFRNSWSLRIFDPSGPTSRPFIEIMDPIIPAGEVHVFVGGSPSLGSAVGQGGPAGYTVSGLSSWISRVRARGQPGADFSPGNPSAQATDFAPAAGWIAFALDADYQFSLTQEGPGIEFVSLALHELGHVLGIGTCPAWERRIQGLNFSGPITARIDPTGIAVTPDRGHFDASRSQERAYGAFGTAHGQVVSALMVSSLQVNLASIKPATDLDLAVLADIGWEVRPPLRLQTPELGPAATRLTWPSSSVDDYLVERADDPSFATAIATPRSGDGSILTYQDPAPPPTRAFYRLRRAPYPPAGTLATRSAPAPAQAAASQGLQTETRPPQHAGACRCGDASHRPKPDSRPTIPAPRPPY